MKIILTEEQFKRVILKEQSISILSTKTGSFPSTNSDSAHNFKQMEDQIGDDLDNFYKQGINPKINKVSATINMTGSNFTTTYNYEIIDNDSGEAWTGFFSRGSIGGDHELRAKIQRYDKDPDNKVLKDSTVEQRMIKFANAYKFEDIQGSPIQGTDPNFTQYFVQFTKTNKPSHSKDKPSLTQHVPHSISKTDLDLFVPEVREKTADQNIDLDSIKLTVSLNKQNLTYTTSDKGTLVYRLVLAVSESEKKCVSCENIKAKNESIDIDKGTFIGKWNGTRIYELIALPK